MANQKHLDLLKQGVEVWNQWRREHPDIQPNLREANLIGAMLIGAELNRADLSRAMLSHAELHGVNLIRANLLMFYDLVRG